MASCSPYILSNAYEKFCKLCQINIDDEKNHLQSKKHNAVFSSKEIEAKKVIDNDTDIRMTSEDRYDCTACHCKLVGIIQLIQHVSDKDHEKKKNRALNIKFSKVMDLNSDIIRNTDKPKEYYCDLCDDYLYGAREVVQHSQKNDHISNVLDDILLERVDEIIDDIFVYNVEDPDFKYYCNFCDKYLVNEKTLIDHALGQEHAEMEYESGIVSYNCPSCSYHNYDINMVKTHAVDTHFGDWYDDKIADELDDVVFDEIDKDTFYCSVCDTTLGSDVTAISHARGWNHISAVYTQI